MDGRKYPSSRVLFLLRVIARMYCSEEADPYDSSRVSQFACIITCGFHSSNIIAPTRRCRMIARAYRRARVLGPASGP